MVLYFTNVPDLNLFIAAAERAPALEDCRPRPVAGGWHGAFPGDAQAPRPRGLARLYGLAGWVGLVGLAGVGNLALPLSAIAQAGAPTSGWAPLRLQQSEVLVERLPSDVKNQASTFFFGDRLSGQTGVNTVLEGNAELRRHDMVVRADRMEHVEATDTATATGQVRINRLGDVFEGPELQLKLDTFEGYFTNPRFSLLRNGGQGEAERMEFRGESLSVAFGASYTTCARPASAGDNWEPDWTVTASRIEFDNAEETGTATNGVLRFKGVPLLASPYVSFPLSDRRKSGVLPPTINLDSQSGLELTLPYYLNLAPNRDATLYPTLMSKRGIDLGGEFRYLERNYAGTFRGAYMPSDRLRNGDDRWAASLQHSQALGPVAGRGGSSVNLNLNRVSDDNYWRDFPRSSTTLTERLLPSDAAFNWASGNWSLAAGAYTWQTLQDVDAPITPPYDRVPSLTLRYAPQNRLAEGVLPGTAWSLEGDLTRFKRRLAAAPNSFDGTRAYLLARASHTWLAPAWSLTPAVQLHLRRYQFDANAAPFARDTNVAVPTFTVDGNLFFEREASFFGRAFTQTLEPRVFYAYTPFRDQSNLPVYDTSAFDFNLATIYSANPFGGQDRIADVNTATVGVTSRLLDPQTGAEVVNAGIAQRYRFSDQRVTLPGTPPVQESFSDVLVGARINWSPAWSTNGTVQFNPDAGESVRTTLGARYSPGDYRVLNAAYRVQRDVNLQRDVSELLDVGWQWPLSDLFGDTNAATDVPGRPGQGLGPGRWYSVGRINYSFTENRVVDFVAGFEYDAGCWIGRFVLERLQQTRNQSNARLLFQLEFSGFSRLGVNPLQTLRENIPRYQYLREAYDPPSRFERYE